MIYLRAGHLDEEKNYDSYFQQEQNCFSLDFKKFSWFWSLKSSLDLQSQTCVSWEMESCGQSCHLLL